MNEYLHSKSVLAFQLAQGDMFRAQEHLLTPSELWDASIWSRSLYPISVKSMKSPLCQTKGFRWFWRPYGLLGLVSRSSDGVRRCSWARNMSPWANWVARTGLEWKYSLNMKWEQKRYLFCTNTPLAYTNFLSVHLSMKLCWFLKITFIFSRNRTFSCWPKIWQWCVECRTAADHCTEPLEICNHMCSDSDSSVTSVQIYSEQISF